MKSPRAAPIRLRMINGSRNNLSLPEVYDPLPHLLEIRHFESPEIGEKARLRRRLIDAYTRDAG